LSLISLFLGNIILKSVQDLFITKFMNVISNQYAKFDFFLICFKFLQVFKLFAGEIQCEQPNNSLYTFTGNLITQKQTLPLSPNQVLLRVYCLSPSVFICRTVFIHELEFFFCCFGWYLDFDREGKSKKYFVLL